MSFVKPVLDVRRASRIATLAAPDASAQARHRGGGGGGVLSAGRSRADRAAGRARRPHYAPRVISPRVVGVVPFRPYYYPRIGPVATVGFSCGLRLRVSVSLWVRAVWLWLRAVWLWLRAVPGTGMAPDTAPAMGMRCLRLDTFPRSPGSPTAACALKVLRKRRRCLPTAITWASSTISMARFQHLNLQAGAHRLEIRDPRFPTVTFDVNVHKG